MTWTAGVNANSACAINPNSRLLFPRALGTCAISARPHRMERTPMAGDSSITLPNELMNALARARRFESLNSFTRCSRHRGHVRPKFPSLQRSLRGWRFQREVGFSSFIEVDSLDEDAASSLADFLYNSIDIVNDSLGTGYVSPLLAH